VLVEILAAWDGDSDAGGRHVKWRVSSPISSRVWRCRVVTRTCWGLRKPARVQQAYGVNLARLRELMQRYDPDGVFSCAVGSFAEPTHA